MSTNDQSSANPVESSKGLTLRPALSLRPSAIAIGSSTGGPQALLTVLKAMTPDITQPIFITQHIPSTFTPILAEQIRREAKIDCREAIQDEPISGGRAYLAPGNVHMTVIFNSSRRPIISLTREPPENFCRPAIDPMFRSLAAVYGKGVLAVILTGMGSDGCNGARAIVKAGGSVIAQDEATSVIWGMPGAVVNAGLCSAVLPVGGIGPYIRKQAQPSGQS